MKKRALWLYRPLINWRDSYVWADSVGVKKMMPSDQLHLTLATVREPCDWSDLELHDDTLVIPAGYKTIQIFGWDIKALTLGHPDIKSRHEELVKMFPDIDHPLLRPHVSLFRGGRLPTQGYEGELIFGPEIAAEFDAELGKAIKHVKVADYLKNN